MLTNPASGECARGDSKIKTNIKKVMKQSAIILILFLLAMLKTQAQNYLISFTGSGDTTGLESVQVKNLTSNATLTLNGQDVLHLVRELGINTPEENNAFLKISPNPMTEQSILTFVVPEEGSAIISLIDLSGKNLGHLSASVTKGTCRFRISGLTRGMYFVKVLGNSYNYSTKLISQSAMQSGPEIEFISRVNIPVNGQPKSSGSTVDMQYNDGEILTYTGKVGQFKTVVTDIPVGSKTTNFHHLLCMDSQGQSYSTVLIAIGESKSEYHGFMGENYNNGRKIDRDVKPTNLIEDIEKYCYEDLLSNCNTYGGLYTWDEMMGYVTTEEARGICPEDWHIPSDAEWLQLTTYLKGALVAGGKIKSTGDIEHDTDALWNYPNNGATDETGFHALPGGFISTSGKFIDKNESGYFWSSTQSSSDHTKAENRNLNHNSSGVNRTPNSKTYGLSVRCLYDKHIVP